MRVDRSHIFVKEHTMRTIATPARRWRSLAVVWVLMLLAAVAGPAGAQNRLDRSGVTLYWGLVPAAVIAATILWSFGFSWWSALLAALLLVCPVLILWGAIEVVLDERRQRAARRNAGPH